VSPRRLAPATLLAWALWTAAAAAQPAAVPPAWEKMGVQAYETPRPAPGFALPALDGRTVRLQDGRGKGRLLFFWATW
jgi:hypothetical protein